MPPGPQDSVAAAVDQALVHQPQIIAALGKVDSSEAMLKSERRSYYPTIELAGRGFQNMGSVSSDGKPYSTVDKPGGDIMLSLSVPLFDGGMRASRISMAAAKMHEAEDKLAEARDATAQQVVKAYNALTTSLAEGEAAHALSAAAHTAYAAAAACVSARCGHIHGCGDRGERRCRSRHPGRRRAGQRAHRRRGAGVRHR